MARTKADAYTKAGVKAPRKTTVLRPDSAKSPKSGSSMKSKYAGGNPACPRPVPDWQKPITRFFKKMGDPSSSAEEETEDMPAEEVGENEVACSSSASTSGSAVASTEPAAGCSNEE